MGRGEGHGPPVADETPPVDFYKAIAEIRSTRPAELYAAEFVGTFFLVLTVGCNVISQQVPTAAALSIGSMLMVMVYSLGTVSGAHFNPAVTIACFCAGKLSSWKDCALYIVAQLTAGFAAGLLYFWVTGKTFALAPVGTHSAADVVAVETLYTAALCYVVLNVACAEKARHPDTEHPDEQPPNNYFGLAIGFTVTAAALAIGGISGCSLNPAVTFGTIVAAAIDAGGSAFTYFPLYFFTPFLGAFLGVAMFMIVRMHEDFNKQAAYHDSPA